MTPSVDVAASVSAYGALSRGTRNASSFDFELVWCQQGSCSNLQDQDVSFTYYQDNPTRQENNAVTLTPSQKLVIQRNALNALGLAFSNYSVRVGEGHQGTNTVFVAGEYPQPQNGVVPCADTIPFHTS